MNKFVNIFASAVVVLGTVVATNGVANAARNDAADLNCEVYSQSYSVGKDTVTANFGVRQLDADGPDCTKDVTVAAWNAPNGTDGMPFSAQSLHSHKSGTYAPGNHSVTVSKPECFYQVDVVRGLSPEFENGDAGYADWQYVSSTHGGAKCETKKKTPVVKKTVQKGTGGPVALPETGAGSVAAIALSAGTAAGVAHNIRARRNRR